MQLDGDDGDDDVGPGDVRDEGDDGDGEASASPSRRSPLDAAVVGRKSGAPLRRTLPASDSSRAGVEVKMRRHGGVVVAVGAAAAVAGARRAPPSASTTLHPLPLRRRPRMR